jgi:tol-pal system protein YbgF
LGGLLSAPVLAQTSREDANRIQRLENEVQTLSRAVYRGETPPAGSFSDASGDSAALGVRLDQLETQLRDMNGRIEEQANAISQLRSQMERMNGDIETRFNEVGSAGSAAAPASQYTTMGAGTVPPQPSPVLDTSADSSGYQWSSTKGNAPSAADSVAGVGSAASGSLGSSAGVPNDAGALVYENAFTMLKNGQYDGAEKEFQTFLSQYPSHTLASNAKYWLGESYYARGDFDKASRTFAEAYQQGPKNAKAPDNLLKLGMSLGGLGKKDDACIALGQIEKQYSATAGPVLGRAKQEMARFGC